MNNTQATEQALQILRSGENFQWYVITLLALVFFVYNSEIAKGNWKGIAAALSLYMVHWSAEIINALIQHFSGHALWTVPTGTAFLLLVGVGVELSLMFSITGLVASKVLPKDPALKIFGVNNRLFFAILWAGFFSLFEIFLARTPAFVWVYSWWGALPVFLMVYIPFFLVALYCYDWSRRRQWTVIGTLFTINALALIMFAGVLQWI